MINCLLRHRLSSVVLVICWYLILSWIFCVCLIILSLLLNILPIQVFLYSIIFPLADPSQGVSSLLPALSDRISIIKCQKGYCYKCYDVFHRTETVFSTDSLVITVRIFLQIYVCSTKFLYIIAFSTFCFSDCDNP